MIFYSEARVDGLMKRVEDPSQMTEHFTDREDFLFYRHVEFGKRPKKFGPAENTTPRPILVCSWENLIFEWQNLWKENNKQA